MGKYLYILFAFIVLSSCGEYQKTLKATDIGAKFKLGEQLYNEGEFSKANRLFSQIVPSYRGKPQAEKLMYMYAQSYYGMKDYYVAGYQFERFADSYPNSEKLEEASFLSAKSYYKESPIYSKDQASTKEAIEKLQLFINQFPGSEYLSEASGYIQELDAKLERKAFEIAKQYNTIQDYQASIKSFDNFLFEFPGSALREEAMYYRFDSAYQLAIFSIERKKQERLESANTYYDDLMKGYSETQFLEEADTKHEVIVEELKNYSTKS
ncbi:outer membrane protein assembly factor BamD [Formosa algae]|jgi:outer membrane protein assembly factor BamD|uniref:Outer membrane protein assembly factor BamD n=1 Tax=Formosa algae TaxID=225843 RepID=A0A9X0YKD5_9FLAO|nr:outer membrane protein assembly factor BamD [Formosa algae]MBP1840219.1 outer membrane protein assembly factor BamD [Formosa algae]MDQ0335819.1 outer membrane protein assembly factor BamD [Formosa algae]OEI80967.1 outer membrane protein assembly factor BamD [Formosa algae]PNW25856.1 outer membrane protein assembly factor BamD [Formosa algae]